MSLSTNRDRSVLARVQLPSGVTIDCHATGDTGTCSHPLAECPSPGCPGSFCPYCCQWPTHECSNSTYCGKWLCRECQALQDQMQALLADGLARLEKDGGDA